MPTSPRGASRGSSAASEVTTTTSTYVDQDGPHEATEIAETLAKRFD